MTKYTKEDLKNSPQTLIKFFVLQGKAEVGMMEDAHKFYCTFSLHHKKRGINSKLFQKNFIKAMDFYNSI